MENLVSFVRDEGEYFFCELVRLLEMRKMAGAFDPLEARAGNGGAICLAVLLAEHTTVGSPEKPRRHANAMQPARKLGVVREGRPCVACTRFPVARCIS